jgi:hypothetical protein
VTRRLIVEHGDHCLIQDCASLCLPFSGSSPIRLNTVLLAVRTLTLEGPPATWVPSLALKTTNGLSFDAATTQLLQTCRMADLGCDFPAEH